MNLESFGADAHVHRAFQTYAAQGLILARVAVSHRDFYRLYTEAGEVAGEPAGALWHRSAEAAAMPVVGDWVAARIVGPAQAKGATPLLNVTNPLSLAADTTIPSHVLLYIGSDPLGLGNEGQVDKWDILLQTDKVWADTGTIGAIPTSFANPSGLALAPGGILYVADDPSVNAAGTTATPGQGHVYSVGP